MLPIASVNCFITIACTVKCNKITRSRFGYTNVPIGHNHFQHLFSYAISKTNKIKNAYKKGTNAKGKTIWGYHYLLGSFRKSIITLYGASGLSTSQIQTYTTHTSAAMVDHYVQQHHLAEQRKENNKKIRDFIDGSSGGSNGKLIHRQNGRDYFDFVDDLGLTENDNWPFQFDDSKSLISCSPSLRTYSSMFAFQKCFFRYYTFKNIYICVQS